jgi:hypothetical protein
MRTDAAPEHSNGMRHDLAIPVLGMEETGARQNAKKSNKVHVDCPLLYNLAISLNHHTSLFGGADVE